MFVKDLQKLFLFGHCNKLLRLDTEAHVSFLRVTKEAVGD